MSLDQFISDNFVFVKGMDQVGCDLIHIPFEEKYSYLLKGYDDYIAFNTSLYFKYDITELQPNPYLGDEGGIYIKKECYKCDDVILEDSIDNDYISGSVAIIGHRKNNIDLEKATRVDKFDFNRALFDFQHYIDVENVESIKNAISRWYDVIIDNSTDLFHHHINVINNCARYADKHIVVVKVKKCNTRNCFIRRLSEYVKEYFEFVFYHDKNDKRYKRVVFTRRKKDIKIFYHVYAIANWKDIVKRQMETVRDSGMMYKLFVFAICEKNVVLDYIKQFVEVCSYVDTVNKYNEDFTTRNIRYFVEPDDVLIYLHNKGVTRYNTNKMFIFGTEYYIPHLYQNVEDWCKFMEFHLITNYKKCLEKIMDYDVVSVNYVTSPPHFAGNFWMTTGKFIRSIPKHTGDERYIFRMDMKFYSMCDSNKNTGYYPYIKSIWTGTEKTVKSNLD